MDNFTGFFVIVLIVQVTTQNIGPNGQLGSFKNSLQFGPNLAGPSALGLAKSGLLSSGLAGPGLVGQGLAGPGLIGPGLAGPGLNSGYGTGSMGGSFAVTSASPINPTGISVLAENLAIEGPLTVGGQMPFLGTVGLEGNLQAGGVGTVNYGCGNANIGIVNEVPTPGPYSYPGQVANSYNIAGSVANSYNVPSMGNFALNNQIGMTGNVNGVKI